MFREKSLFQRKSCSKTVLGPTWTEKGAKRCENEPQDGPKTDPKQSKNDIKIDINFDAKFKGR